MASSIDTEVERIMADARARLIELVTPKPQPVRHFPGHWRDLTDDQKEEILKKGRWYLYALSTRGRPGYVAFMAFRSPQICHDIVSAWNSPRWALKKSTAVGLQVPIMADLVITYEGLGSAEGSELLTYWRLEYENAGYIVQDLGGREWGAYGTAC